MAETMKTNMNIDELSSRVQSTVGQVKEKVGDVTQDVVERFQDNKLLAYVGIGLLAVGAGFGIWALIRNFREEPFEGGQFYGREDFRSSSQY